MRAFLEGRDGDPTGTECPGAMEADPVSTPVVVGGVETLVVEGVLEAVVGGGRLWERAAAGEGVRRPPPVPGVVSSSSSLTSMITLRRLRSTGGDSVRGEPPPL